MLVYQRVMAIYMASPWLLMVLWDTSSSYIGHDDLGLKIPRPVFGCRGMIRPASHLRPQPNPKSPGRGVH